MKHLAKTLVLMLLTAPLTAHARARVSTVSGFELSELMFTVAAALLLTLLFRRPLNEFALYLARKLDEARLDRVLHDNGHRVAKHSIIDAANGGLTRIDYAVMTAGGIVCIRHISDSGKIQGEVDAPQWQRTLHRETRSFLNPILQNEGRVQSLQKLLPGVPIKNLVVFSGRTRLPQSETKDVVTVAQLAATLNALEFPKTNIDNWDDVWLNFRAAVHDDEMAVRDYAAQINFG